MIVGVDVGERYLELILRFRRLAPALVDSYVGPAELAAEIDREEQWSAFALAEQAVELGSAIAEVEPDADRAAWLQAQLRGVEAACRVLGGKPAGYRELVQRCYEVSVSEVDETQFQRAHELILSGLPGTGSAADRFQAWAATQRVSGERLLAGLQALARELRARCRNQWDLPDAESVRFEMTPGPWAAYAEYKGGLHSVIRFSNELPVTAWRMVELVAHEAYPGHHTEHVFKDIALVRAHNRKEFCVWVYPTPQALIAEGIAMLAPTILLGDEIEQLGAKCLRPLGIDYDTAGSAVVREAHELLLPVAANLTRMSAENEVDRDGMLAYARKWRLDEDLYVERLVDYLCRPTWLPYESCYPEGLQTCRRFVNGDPGRFSRLLREQLTPAALERQASS